MTDKPGRAALLLALLFAGDALARDYPTPILADSEDELRLLFEDGLITEDDFTVLVELLNTPVNINEADRRELYDLPGVTMDVAREIVRSRRQEPFYSLEDLLGLDGVDQEVLEQLYPFAVAVQEQDPLDKVKGRVRVRTAVEFEPIEPIEDDHANRSHRVEQIDPRYGRLPSTYVSATARYGKPWEAGAVLLAQEDIGRVSYSPESRDLYASWGRPVVSLGKAFASYKGEQLKVLVGNYGAGFGLGLAFDRTSRSQPGGFYRDVSVNGTERYSLPHQLFGAAVGTRFDLTERAALETTFFASSQRYDLYQYDLAVGDPEHPDAELSSPRVYIDGMKAAYVTIPNAYRDSLAGFDVTADLANRDSVGLTTMVGHMSPTSIPGVDSPEALVVRAGYPDKRTYGAVGVHGSYGLGPVDLLGESAFTFSGGNGTLLQAVWTPGMGEVTASVRRYGTKFDNPHARGQAAPDEYEGFRDRDELGARADAKLDVTPWLTVRSRVDLWQNLSYNIENLELFGQAEALVIPGVEVTGFGQHTNRNLALNGRSREYGGSFDALGDVFDEVDLDELSDPEDVAARAGSRSQLGLKVETDLVPLTKLSAYYRRSWEDDSLLYPNDGGPCIYWYLIGHYTWFKAQVDVTDATRIIGRVRYLDEDVHGSKGDRLTEGYLQVEQKLPGSVKVSLRGTVGKDLADPTAEWAEACSRNGAVVLDGTCIAEPEAPEAAEPGDTYGSGWLSVEWRF